MNRRSLLSLIGITPVVVVSIEPEIHRVYSFIQPVWRKPVLKIVDNGGLVLSEIELTRSDDHFYGQDSSANHTGTASEYHLYDSYGDLMVEGPVYANPGFIPGVFSLNTKYISSGAAIVVPNFKLFPEFANELIDKRKI